MKYYLLLVFLMASCGPSKNQVEQLIQASCEYGYLKGSSTFNEQIKDYAFIECLKFSRRVMDENQN